MDRAPKAASMIIDPSGDIVGSTDVPTEGLCIAEIDLTSAVELKRLHDVAGYYNRFDIFRLNVNRIPQHPIYFEDGSSPGASRPESEHGLQSPESHLSRALRNRAYENRREPATDESEEGTD
ncbi:hypothetical protein CDEF62S_04526 [Castellaniella defragrans]